MRYEIDGLNVTKLFRESHFPAGEKNITISPWDTPEDKEQEVFFVDKCSGHLHLMSIGMKVDILRRTGFKRISLVLPYLPYARQDRYTVPGASFALKVAAKFINSLDLERVYVVDAHSDVSGVIDNLWDMPIHSIVNDVLFEHPDIVNVIAPDAGAAKKIYTLMSNFAAKKNIVVATKHRDPATGDINGISVPDVEGPCLVIDDICDGGRTFTELAKVMNNEKKYLYVTHGIFSKEDVFNSYDAVWTTDTTKHIPMQANVIPVDWGQKQRR